MVFDSKFSVSFLYFTSGCCFTDTEDFVEISSGVGRESVGKERGGRRRGRGGGGGGRKGGWERGGRREIEEEEGEGRVGKGGSKGERAKMEEYIGHKKYWSGRQKQKQQ